MNVYIVGSGAVGTFLGDKLRNASTTISFAPRRLDDVERVDADLAIVAVKSYDTDEAIASLQRALGPDSRATILCPQNGVGNEEKLAAAFGATGYWMADDPPPGLHGAGPRVAGLVACCDASYPRHRPDVTY